MIKLEKISRKEFCRQLEGKFVCMCAFRTHETFEEDLKVLEENQDYKGKQQYIFYPRRNGFIRAHVSLNKQSMFNWSTGDKQYTFGKFFIIMTKTRVLIYKIA